MGWLDDRCRIRPKVLYQIRRNHSSTLLHDRARSLGMLVAAFKVDSTERFFRDLPRMFACRGCRRCINRQVKSGFDAMCRRDPYRSASLLRLFASKRWQSSNFDFMASRCDYLNHDRIDSMTWGKMT